MSSSNDAGSGIASPLTVSFEESSALESSIGLDGMVDSADSADSSSSSSSSSSLCFSKSNSP